jgi:hypothetical protein
MDIHSKIGSTIEYLGTGGYDSDLKYANKYLYIGEKYSIKNIEIHDWNTNVTLFKIPDKKFNSVHFKNIED